MLNMFIMFEEALNSFFLIFSYPVYLNMLKPYRPKKLKKKKKKKKMKWWRYNSLAKFGWFKHG